jgi:hypothetical protein
MSSRFLAGFVGIIVGFLNAFGNMPAEPPPCRLGPATWRKACCIFTGMLEITVSLKACRYSV